ncbi:MAG TPA: hypothetical protein PLQ36_02635 [Candidatus Gracilibacteria bacterium]|nr:hypothetical protein [Candidatus Gracilibacteria bacterium]
MEKLPVNNSETLNQNLHSEISKNLKIFTVLLISLLSSSGKSQVDFSFPENYTRIVHQPAPDGTSVVPIGKQAQIIRGNLLEIINSAESH